MPENFARRAWRRITATSLGSLLKWTAIIGTVVAVMLIGGFILLGVWTNSGVPALEPVDQIVYLDQGWGEMPEAPSRQTYYYTPQGTSVPQGQPQAAVRYHWFVHLEQAFTRERFADPNHMRRFRFLVDNIATPANPHQLPVGFTRHFSPAIGEEILDITCAACHTGQLHYRVPGQDRSYAIRIDGGQAMHAFTDMRRGTFGPALLTALISTRVNPVKFNRFARAVLGTQYPAGKKQLREDLGQTIGALLAEGQNNPLRHLYPIQEGYGRTDALGRIANTVFGDHMAAGNYHVSRAPVSYPYLWNIWKFDWVQYNGSVAQPLARNVGEAMGVGAMVTMTNRSGKPIPADQRFPSTVRVGDLTRIEHALQRLQPPRWPEDILGPIDQGLAARGKELFETHCQGCHGPHPASAARQRARAPGKPTPDLEWQIEVIAAEHIGTDPAATRAFTDRTFDLSATGLDHEQVVGVLRPLRLRYLAREARYRLEEVIDRSRQAGRPVGALTRLLDEYPDPDAQREASLPSESFEAIDRELTASLSPLPKLKPHLEPPDRLQCDLDCQTRRLLWVVRHGEAHMEQTLGALDITRVSEGLALNIIGLLVKERYFEQNAIDWEQQQCLEGFGTLDLPQVVAGYKPRPLEGVWATPPFLHNGSVPNLYQMLVPPGQRDVRFFVGPRDFDPRHVGYTSAPLSDKNGFWMDTTVAGNHNSGHAFDAAWGRHQENPDEHPLPPGVIGPALSDDQRFAIIEYLKIHRDLPATPADYEPPVCAPKRSDEA